MVIPCDAQKYAFRISQGKYNLAWNEEDDIYLVGTYAELKTLVLDTLNPGCKISISTVVNLNFLHNPFWVPTNQSSQNFKFSWLLI